MNADDARPGRATVLRAAAANGRLRRVLAAYFLFGAAEWGAWIATLVWAYGVGGVRGSSLMSVVQLVPAALAAPFVAGRLERMSRSRALTLGYTAQAVTFAALGVALMAGPVVLVVLAAVATCVAITGTRPVHNAILADLAETTEELTASNSLSGAGEASAAFVGPLGVGLLMVPWGPGGAVLVIAALMAVATVLVMSLTTRRPAPSAGAAARASSGDQCSQTPPPACSRRRPSRSTCSSARSTSSSSCSPSTCSTFPSQDRASSTPPSGSAGWSGQRPR